MALARTQKKKPRVKKKISRKSLKTAKLRTTKNQKRVPMKKT